MKYETNYITLENFSTRRGEHFFSVSACYTVYGELNDDKPLALFFHGLSSNSELHTWWKKFNLNEVTEKYTIICINTLGSSYGSFGPESKNPKTMEPYHHLFPCIDLQDTVNFTVATLKKLRIESLDLVLGCSLGGMQALDMYLRYPSIAKKTISAVGIPVPYMTKMMNLAQARLIDHAIHAWNGEKLETMLGLSRFFFRLTCTSEKALEILKAGEKNMNQLDALEGYFIEDSLKFQTKFSAYSNSLLLKVIAHFELEMPDTQNANQLVIISIKNDHFTPEVKMIAVFEKLMKKKHNCTLHKFKTDYGHEAWIIDGEKFYDFLKKDIGF